MIIVVDVDYRELSGKGHAAGILCETPYDDRPESIVTAIANHIEEYRPGEFYRRELKCIDAVLEQTDISQIDMMIVDGYADFGTDTMSLGASVYEKYRLPVIGIAKNPFKKCVLADIKVFRGNSLKPLFVTCKGMELEKAKDIVSKMAGEYRIPLLVKAADKAARDWSC